MGARKSSNFPGWKMVGVLPKMPKRHENETDELPFVVYFTKAMR